MHDRHPDPALEADYNIRPRRPDYEPVVLPRWNAASETARETLDCRLDLAYGAAPRQALDFFPTADSRNRPTVVYLHGGFWQRGDKSIYSFVARPFVQAGISVAIAGYSLCPDVGMATICHQARSLFAWLWQNAGELCIDQNRLYAMGHSAGGHLTAIALGTDWPRHAPGLPPDLVKGGVPLSGLFDLAPLRRTSINGALNLSAEDIAHESPIRHPPVRDTPVLAVCGGNETDGFIQQTARYHAMVSAISTRTRHYLAPGLDHIDVVDALVDPQAPLFGLARDLILDRQWGGTP